MPFSEAELNRIANEVVAGELLCYIHDNAPGNNGIQNRIGNRQALAPTNWSDAAFGDVTYMIDVEYGIIDATTDHTPNFYSLFRSEDFVGWAVLPRPRLVPAGQRFAIPMGTIKLLGATS